MIGTGKLKAMITRLLGERLRWKKDYTEVLHKKNDIVLDETWLMVANKDTLDKPAPQREGIPVFTLPDIPNFVVNSNTSVVASGNDYTFTDDGWITSIRFWVPEVTATTQYRFFIANSDDPADAEIEEIFVNEIIPGQWMEAIVSERIVLAGARVVVLVEAINTASNTIINGDWTNEGKSQNDAPTSGGWNGTNQNDIIRINDLDDVAADRSADLAQITPSTIIRFADSGTPANYTEYTTVLAGVDSGDHYLFSVQLSDQGGTGASVGVLSNVTITIPVASPTKYVEEAAFWPTNQPAFASAAGFLQFDSTIQAVPNSSFGADLSYQRALLSPDWDFMATFNLASGVSQPNPAIAIFEDLTASTTNSTTPIIKLNTSGEFAASDYIVNLSFEASGTATNRSIVVGLYIDGVLQDNLYSMEPKDFVNVDYCSKDIFINLTAGNHTFRVDFFKAGGGGASSVTLENLRIIVDKI